MAATSKNALLNQAKEAKKNEFYTRRQDIEAELQHYQPYFENKVVYCNCDDPEYSEFWKFFVRVFRPWHIKKLMATHYEPDKKNYAYKLELSEDTNGDGKIDWSDEPIKTQLPCNGDFRSAACIELLKEADIVVTNPPFSLFREYIAQLFEYGKKFIIIGSLNAVKYKEIFPYFKNNQLWLGSSIRSGDRMFFVPDDYPLNAAGCGIDPETGRRYIRVKGVRWFTNIDYPQRHEKLDLRGNYYKADKYPKYDNFDAIDVSVTDDIPCDYDGLIGVPISFLDRYNEEQFDIIGLSNVNGLLDGVQEIGQAWIDDYKKHGGTGHITANMHSLVGHNPDGTPKSFYSRIIIRLKHPEERRYPDED